jgi:glycosyltransferase involved in cell wall biosynthesis
VDLQAFQNGNGRRLRTEWNNPGGVIGDLGNHDVPAELHKLLDAAQILSGRGLTFIIAGRGKAIGEAVRRMRAERISGVLFKPLVPPAEAPDYIRAFDVGVCPYLKIPGSDERSPMRLLMYAAGGLPSVCTDVEEVRRMNFSNVVLVQDNPQALADGILRARAMRRGRPSRIESYDIRLLADRYEKVILGREPLPMGESS